MSEWKASLSSPPVPIWLRTLGIIAVAAIASAAAYAVAIGVVNFSRIGV